MPQRLTAEEAVQQLFELYADEIFRYARLMLQDDYLAEDVVQEVFIRVLRSWDKFREDANAKTWLWSIARNCLYDAFRERKRNSRYFANQEVEDVHLTTPFESLLELEESIYALKENQRQVFILRCIQDLSVSDTASILGWTEAKVKTTLHRAIHRLKITLQEPDTLPQVSREGW